MKHEWIETHTLPFLILTLLVISVGGLVEIIPLFLIKQTVETVSGVRPYAPIEWLGRQVYQREGCYACHSQMIRPLQEDWLRYGHYSLAAESQYDHPFLWGSRRVGPDLARIGGKYPDHWHVQHLTAPRSMTPLSRMPAYAWLNNRPLQVSDIEAHLRTLRQAGIPYSDNPTEYDRNVRRFGEAVAKTLDISRAQENLRGNKSPTAITEMDALVAYLQVLGTMVHFDQYDEGYFVQFR